MEEEYDLLYLYISVNIVGFLYLLIIMLIYTLPILLVNMSALHGTLLLSKQMR